MSVDPNFDGSVELDQGRERQLNTLIALSDRFGDSLSRAFAKNVAEGRKLDDMLKGMGRSLLQSGLRQALSGLQSALSTSLKSLLSGVSGASGGGSGLGDVLGSLFGGMPALAQGGVVSRGMVMPFAQGGVVAAPTYFPLGRGLGLMGERGAEAVMPLARGPDGRLGVSTGGGRPVSVTVHIATPDADSFRRSEAQVSAALARAVARGQRGM